MMNFKEFFSVFERYASYVSTAAFVIIMAPIAINSLKGPYEDKPYSALGFVSVPKKPEAIPKGVIFNEFGEKTQTSSFIGRPTMVHIWASWCGACMGEFNAITKYSNHLESMGYNVAFVSVDDAYSLDAAKKAFHDVPANNLTFYYLDREKSEGLYFGNRAVPTTIFYNIDGQETGRFTSGADWQNENLDNEIKELNAKRFDAKTN